MFRPVMIDARGRSSDGHAVLQYLMEGEQKITATRKKTAIDYYHAGSEQELDVDDERSTSRYIGAGCQRLGLSGDVSIEVMEELAKGFDPTTGAKLSATAGKEPVWVPKLDRKGKSVLKKDGTPDGRWKNGHRVGFDCTFSIADKSASLVFALAPSEEQIRILDAHREAVEEVVQVMQDYLEAGRDEAGIRKIGVKGLVATGHTHFTSRNLDPQIHEHVLTFAFGLGQDGSWGGIDATGLFDYQRMFGAVGRCVFAKKMAALGYGVIKSPELDNEGRETGQVYYRIAGVSEKERDESSSRRLEALEYMAANGGTMQAAVLVTRLDKEEQPLGVMLPVWKAAHEQMRAEDPSIFNSTEELKGLPSKLYGCDDETLLRKLHAQDAVWTKQDLITQLALEHVGQKDVAQLMAEAEAFMVRMAPQLVTIEPEKSPEKRHQGDQPGRKYREDRHAAHWWIEETEQKLVDSAKARQNEPENRVPDAVLNSCINSFEKKRGFKISDEQRAFVRHMTEGTGISCGTGWAGSGKTTAAEIFCQAYEQEGRSVIGVSLAWKAARKLQAETGMKEVHSAAKLLQKLEKKSLTLKDQVIVLDEAGMVDTTTFREIQKAVDTAHAAGGRCKLICVGDSQQLQPVGPGAGFRLLKDAIGDATLTEIRRQRDAYDIETSKLLYQHADRARNTTTRAEETSLGAQIFARLEHKDQIERCDTSTDAVRQMADDYLSLLGTTGEHGKPLEHKNLCVMAGTNSLVRTLNDEIRTRLAATGEFSGDDFILSTKGSMGVRQDLPIAVGERLMFTKGDQKHMGIDNGSVGVVQVVRRTVKGSLVMSLKLESDIPAENGRVVKLDTGTYDKLTHAYAQTTHKSQGATVERTLMLGSIGTTDVHSTLVSATRHRAAQGFKLYGGELDLETMAERLGMERLGMNALEEGRKQAPKAGPSPTPRSKPAQTKRRQKPEPQRPDVEDKAHADKAADRARKEKVDRLWKGYRDLVDREQKLRQKRGKKIGVKIRRGD